MAVSRWMLHFIPAKQKKTNNIAFLNARTAPFMNKFLIIGLGNIGPEYAHTRHNIGFDVLDHLAATKEFSFNTERYADKAEFKIKGRIIHLIKPNTYMNLSGKAMKYWIDKLQIPIENSLVIVDDLAIDFGRIRIKKNGSDGGHNGLKSIQEEMKTQNYPRLRFGIGSEYSKGQQIDYVLGKWRAEEQEVLRERIDTCAKAIIDFPLIGIDKLMNAYNK